MLRSRRYVLWVVGVAACLASCGSSSTGDSGDGSTSTFASPTSASAVPSTTPSTTMSTAPATTVTTVTTVGTFVPESLPPSSAVVDTLPEAQHFDHGSLQLALPPLDALNWLPAGATTGDDDDLTSRLASPDCQHSITHVAANEASATNRHYYVGGEALAEITFYDVDSVAAAADFMAAIDAALQCPVPAAPVTIEILNIEVPSCDQVVVVLTHQPVSETIDGWCRVGNLVAWVRLYPSGELSSSSDTTSPPPVPPTAAQASVTIAAAGAGLRTLFTNAG